MVYKYKKDGKTLNYKNLWSDLIAIDNAHYSAHKYKLNVFKF